MSTEQISGLTQALLFFLRGEFFLCHVFSIKSAQNLVTRPAGEIFLNSSPPLRF